MVWYTMDTDGQRKFRNIAFGVVLLQMTILLGFMGVVNIMNLIFEICERIFDTVTVSLIFSKIHNICTTPLLC